MLQFGIDSTFSLVFQIYYTIRTLALTLLSKLFPFLIRNYGHFPPRPYNAVFITGASTGIGKAAAVYLANKGYMVFAGTRKSTDFQELLKEFDKTEKKGFLYPVIVDVTDLKAVKEARKTVEERLKSTNSKLIAVINNAGITKEAPVEILPIENVKSVFEVNVFGVFAVTQEFLPLLRIGGPGGRIINISSQGVYSSTPTLSAYVASKTALEGFADVLRKEVSGQGIAVTNILPGPIATPIFDKAAKRMPQEISSLKPEELQVIDQHYPWFKNADKGPQLMKKIAVSPFWTSLVIHNAIESPFPKTRYFVNVETYVWYALKSVLPDTWLDRLSLALILGRLKSETKKSK
jgi:NAD(P)-dependent dehydrogenase (short-subunit alcohol dehydrogenase family)